MSKQQPKWRKNRVNEEQFYYIPRSRPSSHNNLLVVSTGIPSMDPVIGKAISKPTQDEGTDWALGQSLLIIKLYVYII